MISAPEPNMPLRCKMKFFRKQTQRLRRTAALISTERVSSQCSPQIQTSAPQIQICAHFSQRNHLQNYPFPKQNYRPDSSTATYFQLLAQAAWWPHLDLPSFGINAGHGIRSQAQPNYSVAPWASGEDFHTPQLCFSRNITRRLSGPLEPRSGCNFNLCTPVRAGPRDYRHSLGGNSPPSIKKKGSRQPVRCARAM